MPIVCGGRLMLCAAATVLAGCAADRFAPEPPAGVTLAGAWKLDHAASDDPQKLLERMRAEALKRMSRRVAAGPPPNARGGNARGAQPEEPPYEPDFTPPPGSRADPLKRSPMAHVIIERLARGDFLSVRQGPAEFVLDYGGSQRRFTPGGHSVVSAEGGVGDQSSGWKGREYIIRVRAQLGPDVTEHFALSADGAHLVEKLHIAAEELAAVELTRVYDPIQQPPRQLPNND